MKQPLLVFSLLLVAAAAPAATTNISSWTPLFRGIDYSSARVVPGTGEKSAAISCLRIDLTDPDIQFFGTPHCTNGCNLETLAENTSHFLETYALQAAVNCNFYDGGFGPTDSPLGTPDNVRGLVVSRGLQVSPADDAGYAPSILFTTNKEALFLPNNFPTTNLAGIYTAISGEVTILSGGANIGSVNSFDYNPRTALGLSQDRRYLFMMTYDGRQPGLSDGADYFVEADWLKRFGAWDGINVDGGGSTTLCMANCVGKSIRLNNSSFVAQYGRERNVGHNFGIFARPLPGSSYVDNSSVSVGDTTATLLWSTPAPATTQVEYGLTASYGSFSASNASPVTRHVMTLSGLTPGTNYYYRMISAVGSEVYSYGCQFSTSNSPLATALLFDVTKSWKWINANMDGSNWPSTSYDDSAWSGPGPGLLYVEDGFSGVAPRSTPMENNGNPYSSPSTPGTHYFRTHFNFTGSTAGLSLIFSNYLDDAAAYYLNGAEIKRLWLPAAPTAITYSTFALAPGGCSGDATCPQLFTVWGGPGAGR